MSFNQGEQHYRSRCTEKKRQISTAIQTSKDSFKTRQSSLDIEVEQFVASAKQFADEFYFKYATIRTSKQVAGTVKRAEKAKNNMEQMETEFQPNKQSIKDMVTREVQKEVSKLQNMSAPAKKIQPSHHSWSQDIDKSRSQCPETEYEMVKNKLKLVTTDRLQHHAGHKMHKVGEVDRAPRGKHHSHESHSLTLAESRQKTQNAPQSVP